MRLSVQKKQERCHPSATTDAGITGKVEGKLDVLISR